MFGKTFNLNIAICALLNCETTLVQSIEELNDIILFVYILILAYKNWPDSDTKY